MLIPARKGKMNGRFLFFWNKIIFPKKERFLIFKNKNMKKLICLISTAGKSAKQITDETLEAFQKYNKVEEVIKGERKIPEGFIKCKVCGEYNGETKMKNLNWGDEPCWKNSSEDYVTVSCLCYGILCHKCKKNKVSRPISNSYYEEDNTVWHHPYFTGMRACSECLSEIKKANS